ncbi:MAG TPA: sulfurtransferase [Steroidobacteraceae bacterium]|nr:sulfurtransferase [Steroidobacteraceae bacterium]
MSTQLPSHLIEASQLAQALDAGAAAPPLRIFDCRHDLARRDWGRQAFAAAHIPGAVFADLDRDLSGPVTADSGRHPLPDPAALSAFLGAAGVDANTHVVAYDQDKSAFAARLWWLLRWLGHERVSVLNGGWAAWRAAGLPLQSAPAAYPPGRFIARPALAHPVTTAEVARGLTSGDILLLDARGADRFAGQNETIDPVAGHVPGARNQPFALNLAADGRLLPPAALTTMWRQVLGDTPPGRVVAMCGSGVTACHDLLALELAGLRGARLYAGSFSEWIRDPARAVATGPA